MKRLLYILLFCTLCCSPVVGSAAQPSVELPSTERLPGVDLAEGLSQLTGVAISPLLGVSAVGAWRYRATPEAKRYLLPWFCRPYIWGTGFVLLGLCFLKDMFGTVAPPLVKKPLDMAELFESKLSALVACSAFLPFIVSELTPPVLASENATIFISHGAHFASLAVVPLGAWSFDLRFITIPIAVVGFLIVWLAGHAINVLIVLCPFGFIDALLKLFKFSLLSLVVLSSFISPGLGAVVSLVIILIAARIAPWAFRLTFFGTRLASDIILPGRSRRRVQPAEPHAFLARRLAGVPARTSGRLSRASGGETVFVYRPWFVMRRRSIPIPAGRVAISKGLFFPWLLHRLDDQQRMRMLVIFLPRYRSHEAAIASHLGITDLHDSTVMKGLKAVRNWFADTINMGKSRHTGLRGTPMG